jgi:hypothetical protein
MTKKTNLQLQLWMSSGVSRVLIGGPGAITESEQTWRAR